MKARLARNEEFKKFKEDAKYLFNVYNKNTPRISHLDDIYSFNVVSGGREGGSNERVIEVFYGRRAFDVDPESPDKLISECGATLLYERTDDGQVLCILKPAKSANYNHPEQSIIIDIIKDPANLWGKAWSHWLMFIAYMEVTSLDGYPNLFQLFKVFYLRTCKHLLIRNKLQPKKVWVLGCDIFKFSATIGLSGFILVLVNHALDSNKERKAVEKNNLELSVVKSIADNTKELASTAKKIENGILELNKKVAGGFDQLDVDLVSDEEFHVECETKAN